MNLLGRSISAWWLLFLIPLGVLMLPGLLILFFAANNFAGAMLGPPAIWNRPWHSPGPSAVVGRYEESERHWSELPSAPASFELRRDGSIRALNLPSAVSLTTCVISGVGRWHGPDADGWVTAEFSESVVHSACHADQDGYASFSVAGHSSPYSLYLVIDDPDSGEGIWFTRR